MNMAATLFGRLVAPKSAIGQSIRSWNDSRGAGDEIVNAWLALAWRAYHVFGTAGDSVYDRRTRSRT